MKFFPTYLLERVVSALPIIKPFSKRKELNFSYQAYGAYFRPYRVLSSLKRWFGSVWSTNPGCCLTYTSSSIKPFKKTY